MGRCHNSTVIDAPVDQIRAKLRDFHGLSWSPLIESCTPIGKLRGDQIGVRRNLNGVFEETLHTLNDAEHSLEYSIDRGPGPMAEGMSDCRGRVHLLPVTEGNRTFVEWSSAWTGNDKPVAEFCDPIYKGLLADLRKSAE